MKRLSAAERGCDVDGCSAPHNAQGYCRNHYRDARERGDIHKLTDSERFWAHVTKAATCWLWTGPVRGNGYPQFGFGGTPVLAHRHSWELVNGPIPAGLFACHTCDVPRCVNPDHIYAGTPSDNVQDMLARGRNRNQNMGKTHCKRGHELAGANLRITSKGFRQCRTCTAMYETSEWRNRNRGAA